MGKIIKANKYQCKECRSDTFEIFKPSIPQLEEFKPTLHCTNCGTVNYYAEFVKIEEARAESKPIVPDYGYSGYDYWD